MAVFGVIGVWPGGGGGRGVSAGDPEVGLVCRAGPCRVDRSPDGFV
jgi:hypothetical protein